MFLKRWGKGEKVGGSVIGGGWLLQLCNFCFDGVIAKLGILKTMISKNFRLRRPFPIYILYKILFSGCRLRAFFRNM